jgi:hypothetical protein
MKLEKITNKLEIKKITKFFGNDREISGAYTSDLLSDVMANSKKDNVWITLQTHLNIIAVASLKELAAIIIVLDKEIDKDTLDKAESENITILGTPMTAYQVSGKLYELGIK